MCRNARIQPWIGGALVGLLVGGALQTPAAFPDDQPASSSATNRVVAPLILSGRASKEGISAKISTPVADVLNLLDAKMSPEVIKAYIKTVSMAYNPTADELIKLTDRGASTDMLLDLLQRGAEVMARSPQIQPIAYYQFSAPAITYPAEPGPPAETAAPSTEEVSESTLSDAAHTETIILGGPGPGFPPPGPPPRHPRFEGARERRQEMRHDHPAAAPTTREGVRGPGPGLPSPVHPPPPPTASAPSSHPAPAQGIGGRSR